jgi:hypothetical protein
MEPRPDSFPPQARKRIQKNSAERYLMGVHLYPRDGTIRTVDEALRDLRRELEKHLFVIGAANKLNRSPRFRFLIYTGVTGNSIEEIHERTALLATRYRTV